MRSKLTTYEMWLDKIYDTVDLRDRNATWENNDDDLDGLSNLENLALTPTLYLMIRIWMG